MNSGPPFSTVGELSEYMHLVNGKQFFTNLDLRELCLARCAIISSIIPIIGTNLYSRNVVILRQSDTHNAHQLVHLQTTVYYSTTTYRG